MNKYIYMPLLYLFIELSLFLSFIRYVYLLIYSIGALPLYPYIYIHMYICIYILDVSIYLFRFTNLLDVCVCVCEFALGVSFYFTGIPEGDDPSMLLMQRTRPKPSRPVGLDPKQHIA